MRKILFIISNFIAIIIEYALISLIIFLVSKDLDLFFDVFKGLAIFGVLVIIIAPHALDFKKFKNEEELNNDSIVKLIDDVNKKYHKNIKLIIIKTLHQPNPAWSSGKYIFINRSFSVDDIYLEGIVAHELGHSVSGLAQFCFLASLKFSTIFSRFFTLLLISCEKKSHNHVLKVIGFILIFLINILSTLDKIFVYPFIRSDEYFANSFACNMGFGEHIRAYYGHGVENSETLLTRVDFSHPKIKDMVNRLNNELHIDKRYENLYYIGNRLVLAYPKTITLTLPNFIKVIDYDAIKNNKLVKLRGDNVEQVLGRINLYNLEELILPKVTNLNYNMIRTLYKLNNLKVNKDILDQMIANDVENIPALNKYKLKETKEQN